MKTSSYTIIFDGGSLGNPGRGYGSYAISRGRGKSTITRIELGDHMTSNEAEYDTLAAALESLLATLHATGADPAATSVTIRGDSLLVISQLTGAWKAHEPRMQERRDRILALARQFRHVSYVQHPRSESIKLFGH